MVNNGQKANETTFNNAFVSRTDDSDTFGVVGLNNTSDPNSGAQVVNTQRAINKLFDADGTSGEADGNAKNYSSNNYVLDGDSRKVAIERLDQALADKVNSPVSAVTNAVAKFSDATGDNIQASGVTIDSSDNVNIPGNLTVQGDLTVNGTTTTVNSSVLEVADANVTVNNGGNDASAQGAGLTVERTSTNGNLSFDDSLASKWKAGLAGSEQELVTVGATQTLTGKTIDGDNNTVQDLPITSLKTIAGNANKLLSFDGSGAPVATISAPGGAFVDTTSAQTLTNKTIDGDDNTVQDLPITSLKTVIGNADKFLSFDGSGVPVASKSVPTGVVVGTTDIQTLTNKTLTAPAISSPTGLVKGDVGLGNVDNTSDATKNSATATLTNKTLGDALTFTQVATPSTPSAGFNKVYPKADGKFYNLNSSGVEKALGSGSGAGGINYASDLFDGTATTGLATYQDLSQATPVDGTGGAPVSISFALNTTTPLRGTSSQRISKAAADARGEGVSWNFTLDAADYEGGKPVYVTFKYKTSANYANGDVRMFVYDRDGAQLLNLVSVSNDGSLLSAQNTSTFVGVFYPNSSNNDYRLIFHVTTTNTSAWTIDFIDLTVGPQGQVPGAILGAWENWTPTGTWTTNTTYTGRKRRVGDSIEYLVDISLSGAPTAANLTISLPSSDVIDTSKLANFAADSTILGHATFTDASPGDTLGGAITYTSTTAVRVLATGGADPSYGYVSNTFPYTWASGDRISCRFLVPIVGLDASAALSTTQTMLSVFKFNAARSSAQTISNATVTKITNWNTASVNSLNATFSSGTLTIPRKMTALVMMSSPFDGNTTGARNIFIYKNGAQVAQQQWGTTVTAENGLFVYQVISFNQNDTLECHVSQSSGGNLSSGTSNGQFSVVEIPDLSIFSVYGQTEYIEQKTTSFTNWSITAGQYGDLHSQTLQPGEYDVTGYLNTLNNGAVTTNQLQIGVSTTSGNSGTGLAVSDNVGISTNLVLANGGYNPLAIPAHRVVVTSPTTYYLKGFAGGSITNLQYTCKMAFRRIK